VNPLIYSMRNQQLKDALWKLAQQTLFQRQCLASISLHIFQS